MGGRPGMLPIMVHTAAAPHTARGQVVQTGGIVVAIEAAGLVVGYAPVNVGTHHVESVKLPRKAQPEGFVARKLPERGQRIQVGTVLAIHRNLEEHAIHIALTLKHFDRTL